MNGCKIIMICLAAAVAMGCNSDTSPVSGTVKLASGSPVTNGRIFFTSNEVMANGNIQPDGTYKLSTKAENDGAPPGKYTVTILAMEPDTRTAVAAETPEERRAAGNRSGRSDPSRNPWSI